jgi:beta-phosphoglucomutase
MVIIFDMDGVIAHTNPYHRQSWGDYARQSFNHDLTEAEFLQYVSGRTNPDIIGYLLGRQGKTLTDAEINDLGEAKEALFREIYAPFAAPVPGLVEFLKTLKANDIQTAVATSAPTSNLTFILDALNIRPYFDALFDISHVTRPKPDPQVYELAIAALGSWPADAVVFEDSMAGIRAGKGAGAKVVGVATTHDPAELAPFVDDVILDFSDMNLARLARLF